MVAAAAVWDLAERRIPNPLTLAGLGLAVGLRAAAGWSPLASGLLGAALGLGVGLPFFLVGALGGGDVKLLAAVGGFLGPAALVPALLATGLVGGVMALAAAARSRALVDTLGRVGDVLRRAVGLRSARPLQTLETAGALAIPYAVPIAVGAIYARLA